MKAVVKLSVAVALVSIAAVAKAEVIRSPGGTIVRFVTRGMPRLDPARAKPMPLPISRRPLPSRIDMIIAASKTRPPGKPMVFPGGEATVRQAPVGLKPRPSASGVAPQSRAESDGGVSSQEFGTSNQVYSTSRAPYATLNPYRKAGKLLFLEGSTVYECSASLIKRGIAVTAAHCVYNWGHGASDSNFYANWEYIPAYRNGSGPYGKGPDGSDPNDDGLFFASDVYITYGYYANTDTCSTPGITCDDDIALLVLKPDAAGKYAGDYTGWFGYATNSYSYKSGQVQITQLGYPVDLDNGELMERNDARGLISASNADNTLIGSLMGGGSSGGPWVVNFGVPTVRAAGSKLGNAPMPNLVVGVTSWGILYDDGSSAPPKQMGASPFLDGNIRGLIEGSGGACATYPDACKDPAAASSAPVR